ncbi:MAG: DNA internalization-related competence protein ComEC/Rec2 [Phycisphaerales bacterium]|jgi:competence protein ComEC
MDEIKRKLSLIDRQLTGGNYYNQIVSTCPLVFPAVGLIIGILIQDTFSLTLAFWPILLAFCVISVVVVFVFQGRGKFDSYTLTLISSCALIGFMCLGAIRLSGFYKPQSNDIGNLIADEPKLATIQGLILTEPHINRNRNWKFARFKPTDPATSFYLKVTKVESVQGWIKAAGTVRVQVDEPVLDLKAGDHIQAYCWLDKFSPPANPGQFDTAKYLARKNVFIAASVKSRDGIELLKSSPAVFTKFKDKLRQKTSQALLGGLSPQEPSRGLLEALLLGYRGNIDSDTYRAFRETGLLHFISLSGMHLAILVGIIWWLCKTAGLLKPARAAVCIVAVIVFLLIVPPRAPTLRAAIICCVFCVSFFFRRHSNPINTLSLAAIILLLIRPTQLFEAGWQLSFGTVLGILLFTERIHFFLHEKLTNMPWRWEKPKTNLFFLIFSKPGPYFLRLFSVGLAAWLGGAGILLYHFYTITPLASLWTVLVFPLVSAILVLGFFKIILFFLLPTLSVALGIIVGLLSNLLIGIVKLFAHLDFSEIMVGRVPIVLIILYYCIIVFAGFIYFRRPLVKKVICAAMLLIFVFSLGFIKWQKTHRNDLVVTCLDVGHGQAIFVKLPGGDNILFDAGSLYTSNVGERVIIPFLNWSGISKIDAVIISHSDTDHINGIPKVVENCEIGGVYANDDFFDKTDRWGTEKFLNACLAGKGLSIKGLDENLKFSSVADIKFLWPDEQASKNEDLSDNDKSLVSLIEFAGTKILLCSDIEEFAQRQLLRLYSELKSDIVVVPHHGSLNTLDTDFLKNLDGDILVCSCGRRQYERQWIIREQNDAKIFYTPKDGAVTFRISKNGMIKTTTFKRN